MKKIYYLSSCNTCMRIINSLNLDDSFVHQDIKTEPLSSAQLEQLCNLSGSYESLFNKRARLYKERQLKDQNLKESDFKALLLEHYTFLKRPVFVIEEQLFIGNSKSTVQALAQHLNDQ